VERNRSKASKEAVYYDQKAHVEEL